MARLSFSSRLLFALVIAIFPFVLTAQNAAPVVRRETPKPVSARPSGLVSVSTAESGGLHDHAPLHSLPAFQVTKLDGTASGIASFQQPKHWLLLYRRENCVPCDRVLKTIAESDNALLKSRHAARHRRRRQRQRPQRQPARRHARPVLSHHRGYLGGRRQRRRPQGPQAARHTHALCPQRRPHPMGLSRPPIGSRHAQPDGRLLGELGRSLHRLTGRRQAGDGLLHHRHGLRCRRQPPATNSSKSKARP